MTAPSTAPTRPSPIWNVLFVSLMFVVIAMAIVIWQQRVEIRRLAAASIPAPGRADLSLRTARARSVLVVPPRPAAPMPDELRSLDEATEFARPMLAAPRVARSERVRPRGSLERLLDNPEFFQALGRQRQAALDARFAALFRQLALSDDELAAFKRLLTEKDSVALDVLAVSETQPDGPLPPPQLNAGIDAARAQVDAAIHTALGDERYAVYQEYERTLPQRTLVAQLEQRLSYSPAPLASAQAESLVRILIAHAPPAAPDAPAASVVVDPAAPAAEALASAAPAPARVSEAAIADAQAVLAPRQVAALREIQGEQQAAQRAIDLLRENLPPSQPHLGTALRTFLQ